MIPLLLTAALLVPVADAQCTHEQAAAEGQALSKLIQARMAADPARTRAILDELQRIGQQDEAPGSFPNWSRVCALYDAMRAQAR